jgi:hypothetical protein
MLSLKTGEDPWGVLPQCSASDLAALSVHSKVISYRPWRGVHGARADGKEFSKPEIIKVACAHGIPNGVGMH